MNARKWQKALEAPVAKREAAWRLYVEHELKPRVQFYETKRHLNKASALKRALAIHRHQGWRLRVLFAEGTSGERIEAAEINDWCERAPSVAPSGSLTRHPCSSRMLTSRRAVA